MTQESRTPVPRALPASELIRMIAAGEIKLPMFQRGFVWTQEKVSSLLDSIYNGYPIGMLLFWQTFERLPEETDLGDFGLPGTPDMQPTNYVLDGQQRLVTLYGSLKLRIEHSDHFPVYFDLRTHEFLHEGGGDFPHRLPLWVLSDIEALLETLERLRQMPDGSALVASAQNLVSRFQSYQVPILELRENDIAKIAPIFERINSTATRLTLFDFMVAALWTPEFNLKSHVAEIRDSLEPKGFDDIQEDTVMRALAAIVLDSAKRETMMTGLRGRDRAALTGDMTEARGALQRAVDFLSSDVRVVGDDLLPYERQLVLLAYIFHHHRHPNAAQTRTLRRWFWRTSFSERYRRGGEGLFDEDLAAALKALFDPDELERFGEPPRATALISSQFRVPAAFTKAYVALLASHNPVNLRSGRPIDVAKALSPYNRRQFHHVFPQAFLKERLPNHSHKDSIVNICMLGAEDNRAIGARAPSDYLGELRGTHANFDSILESNLIPATCWPFIESDDFDGFLKERADFLQTRLSNLMYGP
ncbi:MAG: DUF262 domain-containing protein [Dehalococcoidia bacterium]|nr:DUF262 domain-containing protein [Dehalococcoidia bacterium]